MACILVTIRTRRNRATSSSLSNGLLRFRAAFGIPALDTSFMVSSAVDSVSCSWRSMILRTVIPQVGLSIGCISIANHRAFISCKRPTKRLLRCMRHHSTFYNRGRCCLAPRKRPCSCLPSARAGSTDPMVARGQSHGLSRSP